MLSEETEHYLTELAANEATYVPSATVAEQLREKTLILLVGPTCVGKTTIMQEILQQDERFAITGTFTTREKRGDDQSKNYTYIPHTDAGITAIYQAVQRGEAVQYAVHPTSGRIYGSDITHYPKDYDMLDTLSSAVAGIEKLPAKRIIVIGVTVAPDTWLEWFNGRFPVGNPERIKRRDEAIQSLEWLLARPAGNVFWIVNGPGKLNEAASEVIQIALNESSGNHAGAELAKSLLTVISGVRP